MTTQLKLNTLAACTALLLAAPAWSAPVGVDGVLGPEWTGVPVALVAHDAAAPQSNFGSPGPTTAGASYSVRIRSDSDFYYGFLQITGDAASAAGNFANLYFDTDPLANNGSDVGFEITNNQYFIAGAAGFHDASAYLTFDSASHPGSIEFAISNSFFTSGPLAGMDYPDGYPAAAADVVLSLSQSFGYSVAGGASYGPTRLGSAPVAGAAAVPEPASMALVLAALGALGFAGRRRG
ncbi:MAG: PEP-CTERM sorting domain-containing protein [Pseudomonadota bacterium]|nr:PEP-CTERM sorting domain-containing protein [Pseudomonadota bacterium]